VERTANKETETEG